MQLTEMLETSKTKQETITKTVGDWRQQLDQLKKIVKETNSWQETLEREFGRPTWGMMQKPHFVVFVNYPSSPFYFDDEPILDDDFLIVGNQRFNKSTIASYGKVSDPAVSDYINRVAIRQRLETRHLEETAEVHYRADLHIDENSFLQEMLPTLYQSHDPIYNLYDISIIVPRAELVKESIHLLNERLSKPKTPGSNSNLIFGSIGTISIAPPEPFVDKPKRRWNLFG